MDKLTFKQFFVVGHDIGMWIAFTMATKSHKRVLKVALGGSDHSKCF